MRISLSDVATAVGGRLLGEDVSVRGVSTDTRTLLTENLFVALAGDTFDGHRFVEEAVARGAAALLVHQEVQTSLPVVRVSDSLRALGDLAGWHRRRLAIPVVAVTGSNGKTTTKEFCAGVLGQAGEIHRTQGNFNNLIGLPLTLLSCTARPWAMVLEMGMNVPGEIARLTEIASPTVGLITNVAPAHLQGLGDVASVAKAKGELFAGLPRSATAVVNADDPLVTGIAVPLLRDQPRLTFGRSAGTDVRLIEYAPSAAGGQVVLSVMGQKVRADLPTIGAHNAMNATAAAAVGLAVGMDVAQVQAGLEGVSLPAGRLRVVHVPTSDWVVLDDTYNANPSSVLAALAAQADVAHGRRRWVVLGDMLELGPEAPRWHAQVGEAAAAGGAHAVLALGEHARSTADGARDGGAKAVAFDTLEELTDALDAQLRAGDVVLVKGSRGARMERVVAHLVGERA